MNREHDSETALARVNTEGDVSFAHVTAVATGWMLDFLFVSLCRSFKEAKLDEFHDRLSTFDAIFQSSSVEGDQHDEKKMIIAFLSRVMHGKQLDSRFDDDERMMPLMSAAKIWSKLEDTVAEKGLFENITMLLLTQSVAVCLEKGQTSSASSALKWFEDKREFPQNVRVKLSTIVTRGETYHPFLMSFSCLLENIFSYLDAYLEKNPCDYLLKEATKMVQSSHNYKDLEDVVTENSFLSGVDEKNETRCVTKKRQLLPAKITDLWNPGTCKKPYVSVQRLSKTELVQKTNLPLSKLSRIKPKTSVETSVIQKTRKPPQKWTKKLDNYLKSGVERHGQGKWAQILKDYDFEGRTGTMLKDRWRILMRADEVC